MATTRSSTLPAEAERLSGTEREQWMRWGPYLAERQWGTVREDYSPSGDAWNSFPHEHARSRAYRWGEDGLLGISDDKGLMCFALGLWNEKDPILKERAFGLTNPEGNHGEDVKECYYYLDATPSASYLKALYKYPQTAFPYEWLRSENGRRNRSEPEFELLDTGVFDENKYFDVFIEYAKAAPNDLLVRITAHNRGPESAPLHFVPTLWFRNTWSWNGEQEVHYSKPSMRQENGDVVADHEKLGRYRLSSRLSGDTEQAGEWLFTDNETNSERLYEAQNPSPYVKDAFHEYIVSGRMSAVNPDHTGTKVAAHHRVEIPPGGSAELRLRLMGENGARKSASRTLGTDFERTFTQRIGEADAFYKDKVRPEDEQVFRQATAGMVWSKQLYYYAVNQWRSGDPIFPPPQGHSFSRNWEWDHLNARDVISMPDKWEFPWFAAWDLAFHAVAFAPTDPQFAKDQLILMLREWYMHPNGQLAAYEYNFGDVNPPVHAWACRVLTQSLGELTPADIEFLERVFVKLAINFTWWVNRKDERGNNLFSGGFLGLDNIGVFDRSMQLPEGMTLEQADGTAWMALYCLELLKLALGLSTRDPGKASLAYEDAAIKFFQHFEGIRRAINSIDGTGLWNDEEGFYLDHIRLGGQSLPLKVHSVVGLLPMIAAAVFTEEQRDRLPGFADRLREFVENVPTARDSVRRIDRTGKDGETITRWLVSIPSEEQLRRMLEHVFNEDEFLSPHGIRSLSKRHLNEPFVLDTRTGQRLEVSYLPGEADTTMFGGNSNWRGPVWMPINFLLLESLGVYYQFYGDTFKVEFPTGSGNMVTLIEARNAIAERLLSIFRPDERGRRPVHGSQERYGNDPNWKDLILFNEYFDGDTGRGCGASHQTGWTGLAATIAWVLKHRSVPAA